MDDTGRIRRPLSPTARRIVFGDPPPAPSELELTSQVDRAHLVMLAEQELVDRAAAAALLGEIELLRGTHFAPLHGAEARLVHVAHVAVPVEDHRARAEVEHVLPQALLQVGDPVTVLACLDKREVPAALPPLEPPADEVEEAVIAVGAMDERVAEEDDAIRR